MSWSTTKDDSSNRYRTNVWAEKMEERTVTQLVPTYNFIGDLWHDTGGGVHLILYPNNGNAIDSHLSAEETLGLYQALEKRLNG